MNDKIDVQKVPRQVLWDVFALPRLGCKNDGNKLVKTASATFEKPVIQMKLLQ